MADIMIYWDPVRSKNILLDDLANETTRGPGSVEEHPQSNCVQSKIINLQKFNELNVNFRSNLVDQRNDLIVVLYNFHEQENINLNEQSQSL